MSFIIKVLKHEDELVEGQTQSSLVQLPNTFETKEEAFTFLHDQMALISISDVVDVYGFTVDGNSYHYFQVEEVITPE
jgi:hypothetical protein